MHLKRWMGLVCALSLHGQGLADDEWPRFRGPQGDGFAAGSHLPVRWSESENVRWKTAIPNTGWSSPVIQDNRVWVTSATTNGSDFFAFCVDAETGRVLIEKQHLKNLWKTGWMPVSWPRQPSSATRSSCGPRRTSTASKKNEPIV